MNFDLTTEQNATLTSIKAVLAREVAPSAAKWDRGSVFPDEAVKALGRAGASGIYIPREYGGQGRDTVCYSSVIEEISSVIPALGITFSVNNSLYCNPIVRFGTDEQKERFVRPVATGGAIGAFALTEAEAGSDATRLKTRVTRDGDSYLLNGEKVMVTSGGVADFILVIGATDPAKTSRGLTAFVVPSSMPGVIRGERQETLGLRSSDVRDIRFDNVRLTESHRIGDENHGMTVLLEGINSGRIGVGAQAVGIARGAYQMALRHARSRRQFNKFLHEIPAVKEMLADMATGIEAARLTVRHAAQIRDRGEPFYADAARAKLTGAEMCLRVTSLAIQVFGGWGYMTDTGVERYFRDAKITELYEGTSEMQRIVLAGSLTHG